MGIKGLTKLLADNAPRLMKEQKYQLPDDWPYKEARELFKNPKVLAEDDDSELKWSASDEEGLIAFLVNENGFNGDRVTKAIEKIKAAKNKSSQGRVESFFKPVMNSSTPIKRKETAGSAKDPPNKKAKGGGRGRRNSNIRMISF